MHFLSVALAILAFGGSKSTESNVAPCDKAIIGHGSADWRSESIVAGPVGAMRHPLSRMERTPKGLVTKMGLLVEGREPETVTVSVPPRLRGRAFLYYGGASSFAEDRGYSEVEFELCGNKPRTIWPGGIRVKGGAPVHLDVFVANRAEPFVLHLGRPRAYEPPS